MKAILMATFLAVSSTIHAEAWPTNDDTAKAMAGIVTKSIEVAPGHRELMKYEITTKGNGVLSIPGINIRIYDGHDDGVVFDGNILKCEWKDIDQDGYVDLVVSGVATRSSDDDEKIEKVNISGTFRWNPKKNYYESQQCESDIYSWVQLPPQDAEPQR